jgi:hypothetical protein
MTDRLSSPCEDPPWLVALDIDGTLLHEDGSISDAVIEQVRRLDEAGHQVMLATGRSSAATIPVLEHLGITPRFLVCSNGAITLHRDAAAPSGYRREWVDSFDPTDALRTIHAHLGTPRALMLRKGSPVRVRQRALESRLKHGIARLHTWPHGPLASDLEAFAVVGACCRSLRGAAAVAIGSMGDRTFR